MGAHNSGVYVISTPSGRQYVGSAVHFGRRFQGHRAHLRRGTHCSKKLQAAWSKYGEQMRFERLLICAPEHVVMYEQLAIDALRPVLNTAPVAGSTLGYRHTEETKAKFAERRLSFGHAGKQHSAETKARISAIKTGRPSGRKGMPVSDEVKEKISATLRGRHRSPETIAKQKITFAETIRNRRDFVMSDKAKENLRAAKLGTTRSPESIAKQQITFAETIRKRREAKS